MAGVSGYPASIDNFSASSPTNLGDLDSTGRNHAKRHDDLEAAMEAVQAELGVDPAGSASTVVTRLDDLDSTISALDTTVAGKIAASVVTAADDLIIGTGAGSVTNLAAGSVGYVLTSGSAGLTWAEAAGGATVEMSDTEPVDPDNGTLWVDTDSTVDTFSASAYVQGDDVFAYTFLLMGA